MSADEMFEELGFEKQELNEIYHERHLFLDGCIYVLEEILKPLKEE